jgi:uncharacterized Ntn-hydrolase superfamily protein
MTYSIVARDPESGALGVAVQTAMFGVGATVPWAEPGVGVVATQAFAEPAYGPRCLDALGAGRPAPDALAEATAADPLAVLRQVGVVAADGSVAAVTGDLCIDHAGHVADDGFAVLANMMASDGVWPAMADAYAAATGPFPQRLLAALRGAQAAGGDARGVMSAAMFVVAGEPGAPGAGRLVDVRVDRSADPLGDLARLLVAADAYAHYGRSVDALANGRADEARAEIDAGLEALPGEENLRFVLAGALGAQGDPDAAMAELRALIATSPGWETIARSFAAKGFMPVSLDE